MSYREHLHPLRQSQTVDYSSIHRQSSTASSTASSGYSNISENSKASTMSTSASSIYSNTNLVHGHKRGVSEASRLPTSAISSSPRVAQDNLYSMARQSLRPLPQTPGPGGPPRTPPHRHHERGNSLDLSKLSISSENIRPSPLPTSPSRNRSKLSVSNIATDFENGRMSPTSPPTLPPTPPRGSTLRPQSMVLTRSDSALHGSSAVAPAHTAAPLHSPIAAPDLQSLGRSSTSQLRTLSKLAQETSADEFAISAPVQEVVGLRGRRRLQRADQANAGRLGQRNGGYGWEGRNWMDKQRQFLQAYEYLCHIGEAKEWIEDVIHRPIPPIVELEEALRDGVTLAEVVEALNPTKRYRIFRHARLQYRHSDNIAIFFRYLDEVQLPDLFRFELIDLYEKKNIPKVIYCIHALSWLLFRKGIVDFRIGNLIGQLEFEHHELEAMQKGLDRLGANMPSFGNMGADFGVESEPEPEETEEEKIDRELAENESIIVDFQAQIRGAMQRLHLGNVMHHLWDHEHLIVELQSHIRGDFTRQIINYRLQMKNFAVHLQSIVRGFLARRRLGNKEGALQAMEAQVITLQSMIRAFKARNEVRETLSQLQVESGPLRNIQAQIRGFLARQGVEEQQHETQNAAAPVRGLQAAIRGMLLRKEVKSNKDNLVAQSMAIADLQAAARAALTRKQIESDRASLESFSPQWETIQAAIQGKALRQKINYIESELRENESQFGELQACIRAAAVRREIAHTLEALQQHEAEVVEVQAMVRGMLERNRVATDLQSLDLEESAVSGLQAHIRGFLFRKNQRSFLEELRLHNDEVVTLQSMARAMILRSNLEMLLAQLDDEEESVAQFQAAARGFLVRIKFEEKKRFFNENMQKVVKIQSFVRGKLQGEAYKSLTTGKNPPVNAVKNFVHLLNDSDFDFNEEVEFERLRKTVVQQVRQNEMLEQHIDQLDIKIALLVKNKITLDEVVRHQSNFGGHASSILLNSSMAGTNQFDLKALNRNSRKKLELYQQLFFNLQTQPQYLARLFKRMREQGVGEKESKRIEHLLMGLFGYAQKRREEYYLLKLISRSIREEIDSCRAISEYLRGSFFWSKLLANYSRSPRDRKYLRDFIGNVIRDHVIEDSHLDLECDPLQIYKTCINNEELRTGRPSRRPLDITPDMAIKDQETRDMFVDRLRDLRFICESFLNAFQDLLPRMPYGLRFLCRSMFESLSQQFNREPQHQVLQVVGHWLFKFYLLPAWTAPENMGLIERQLSPLQKRNLNEVAKVLNQVLSGRTFGADHVHLQPLNAFVADAIGQMQHILTELISVNDPESNFNIDEFNDLYSKNKPTLYIKMADIFAIHNLVTTDLPAICPNRDDVLREIMHELGSAKNNESEMSVGSSDIQMFLTPTLHDTEDPEADVKALFMETKRCILYIIRVQTGTTLLDILVKPISQEDEKKWRVVLREDFASGNTKGAYSDTNMVDLTAMSYYDLKRTALENILRLEQMGRISKHNQYQDVLNAIAVDIRTKSRRRVQRQRELEGVRMTLSNLHEKAKYLDQQRKSYDDYIEQAMKTLQAKKGYVLGLRFLFSFLFFNIMH